MPAWGWAAITVAGIAMLLLWPRYRRWRSAAVARVGMSSDFARPFGIFSDVCFGVIAVLWTLAGLIGLLRG
jgi:hypothetical protein